MSTIKKEAAKSVIWSTIERFSVQGVQFAVSIVIARLLFPSDYGLIAMLSIFMALAQTFVDSGFANALIQKKNKTDADFNTVFYFNIGISVLVYFLLYITAPYIASFYNEPELKLITRIISLGVVINSFGIVQQAKLTIELNFKKMAYASLLAALCSGAVGIVLAYNGWGVWALVCQTLGNNFLRVVLIWFFSRWSPKIQFSIDSFRALFSFGSKILLSSLLHTVYTNLYTLIIGKFFSSVELGYYNRSFTLAQFPSTNLSNIIVRAIYPIQCRIQDDIDQLRSMFLKYIGMACYIIFPIMIIMCTLAEPLVSCLLTDKWLPIVPLLRILCIAFMWDPVMKINLIILQVRGRSDYFLYAEIIKKIIAFLIMLATIPYGVKVMCVGLIFYAFADMGIIIYYSRKVTEISYLTQCKKIVPIFLLSISTGVVVYIMVSFLSSPFIQLISGVIVGGAFYLLLSFIFKFQEMKVLFSLISKRF